MAKLTIKIPEEMAGMRLDRCLAELFPVYSRSKLQCWIKAGRVSVNLLSLKIKDKVEGGEQVVLDAETEKVLAHQAENIPLDIVYEDEYLLIINKPPGLVIHPAVGNWQGTLVNALLSHDATLKNIARTGIVHRLDKDTSGLLMIAKTLPVHHNLTTQLQARTITREYLALVKGWMTAGGTINAPLGRHHTDRTRHIIRVDGKHAITHYRLEQRFKRHTLIRVSLETGRTHQIRVHMVYIHYPIVGDPVYGGRFQLPRHCSPLMAQALRGFKRQALHATRLGLQHPKTGQYCEWELEPPEDMRSLLKILEDDALD